MATTNISIRMDSDLKSQADALFCGTRHEPFDGVQYLRPAVPTDGGIPFEIKMDQPNKETMAAMLEAERHRKGPECKALF